MKIYPIYESLLEFQGMTPYRDPMDDIPLQTKQMFGIIDSPPTKLYHGGSAGITKDNLAMVRTNDTLGVSETATDVAGFTGFYLTHHINQEGGHENAEKYAAGTFNRTNGKPVCVYEISLSPDIVLATKTGNLSHFNFRQIKQDSEALKSLVKAGIDGFYHENEAVIWNKDKITNIDTVACAKENKFSCAIGKEPNRDQSNAKGKTENTDIIERYFKDTPYKTFKGNNGITHFIGDTGHINCVEAGGLDYIKQ